MAIFTNKKKTMSSELIISSLKLVELLSSAHLEEFCLYQWIFFYDSKNLLLTILFYNLYYISKINLI